MSNLTTTPCPVRIRGNNETQSSRNSLTAKRRSRSQTMNPTGAEILANPHPCGHIVYPYTDEHQVAEAVCLFASAGLRQSQAVVLVMTADHCKPIRQRLEQEGF